MPTVFKCPSCGYRSDTMPLVIPRYNLRDEAERMVEGLPKRTLRELKDSLQKIVDEQAEDAGLWLVDTDNIVVAYLQQELRRLHRAIEGDE